MKPLNLLLTYLLLSTAAQSEIIKRALQKSHEKPRSEKWFDAFLGRNDKFNQVSSMVNLVAKVTSEYLSKCYTVILYDQVVENDDALLLEQLFRIFPTEYTHGQISRNYTLHSERLLRLSDKCVNYILFLADLERSKEIIGEQNVNKVVVVARSSQWRVYDFLASERSHYFVNLLVIAQSEKIVPKGQELPFILYTHKLYIDGLGSSEPRIVTSWFKGDLTRDVTLFPRKIVEGFASHRFICSVAHQPPFVIRSGGTDPSDAEWDGIDVRLVQLLAKHFNFTTDFREAANVRILGAGEAVTREVHAKRAELGLAGIYTTTDRIQRTDLSQYYSQDCAAFISLTSIALPRYRAIMGPFHWVVWLALTLVYLFAIFPIAFSDKHTLSHLVQTPEEIENMFWYVFGTFTNCFTFSGKNSWNNSSKAATRLLIGFYWLFTIIVSACYTGSIIAFVTIPVYPETVDTVEQLLDGGYRIGHLDKGGWEHWYDNLTDPLAAKLLRKKELLPNIESGLKNTTKAFFWSYAFLGSKAELEYIVRTNFTTASKRSVLHISSCFVPYAVSLLFKQKSNYKAVIDRGIRRATESGFVDKFKRDVDWKFMRSATGKLLQASGTGSRGLTVEDRALTLDDTQGMFLLLGIGFLMGAASLTSEIVGGCFSLCKRKVGLRRASLVSNPRAFDAPTPREKLDSVQLQNELGRLTSVFDEERNGDTGDKLFDMNELFGEDVENKGELNEGVEIRSSS